MGYWQRTDNGRTNDDVFVCHVDEPIAGRPLRCLLVDTLASSAAPMSIAGLVEELERMSTPLAGRSSKVVSDALRWEIRNGRVARCGRGQYRFAGAPVTTLARIRRRARSVRRHLAERTAPPPAPPPAPPLPRHHD